MCVRQIPPPPPPPLRVCVLLQDAEESDTSKDPNTTDTTGIWRHLSYSHCLSVSLLVRLTTSACLTRSAFGCPYSDINMRKEVVFPDRLGGEKVITLVPVTMHHHGNQSER